MNNDDDEFKPRLPSVRLYADGLSRELRDLNYARQIRNPISSGLHVIRENSAAKALDATTRRLKAYKSAVDACREVVDALGSLSDVSLRFQVQTELSGLRRETYTQLAIMELQGQFHEGHQKMLAAERQALTAEHGLLATRRNRDLNFRLGDARKQAALSEVADLTPGSKQEVPSRDWRDALLESLHNAKANLLADGGDPSEIDAEIARLSPEK